MSGQAWRRQRSVTTEGPTHADSGYSMRERNPGAVFPRTEPNAAEAGR